MENKQASWTMCPDCEGCGKKRKKLRRKVRLDYQRALDEFKKTNGHGVAPMRPKGHLYDCINCSASGLIPSDSYPIADKKNYPHVAIIGAGIGGVALAVNCLHRNIPFTIYERDTAFDDRSQGYGLTLQQASKVITGFGISSLESGVISTRHVVHATDGTEIGEWGMRKWMKGSVKMSPKHTNVHIARQSLRLSLIEQLGGHSAIKWGHQLVDFNQGDNGVTLNFEVNGTSKSTKANMVVGADGIRSVVRKLLIGEDMTPLRYLDCIVILGICSLEAIKNLESPLLDSATVFQTANGRERIYIMPYTSDSVMWQLSFPMLEKEAKLLSSKGARALKEEACRRTQWHNPIPQILEATHEAQVSGYPVYDRGLLKAEMLKKSGQVTLIGDAAHPMSPFKGQGANQALLDALSLARTITKKSGPFSQWRDGGVREHILNEFESEMLERSSSKVKDSADAARFLHSEVVLHVSDGPRGSWLERKDE